MSIGTVQRGARVLVFVQGRRRRASQLAIARVRAAARASGQEPEIVDVTTSPALADWYGIVRFPAVAIVDGGMLLAIEHQCTPDACERLFEAARTRGPQLRRATL